MNEKIKVEIFGIYNETPQGSGSCGCSSNTNCCSSVSIPTMGESYEKLVEFIGSTEEKDKVALQFIDLMEDEISNYNDVQRILDRGYQLPLIFIDGKVTYAGNIVNEKIYEMIKKSF